jgi:peptide deformylase
MTTLVILEFPDPRLRIKAAPVGAVTDRINALINDMFATMYEAKGIGLAATQVDFHQRIIVMDISETRDEPRVFINPEIEILGESRSEYEEGCLSVPDYRELVSRPDNIRIKALDRNGLPFRIEPDGLLAVCIQHEIDHLDGKLFVDYLSPIKRQRIRDKLKKAQRQPA